MDYNFLKNPLILTGCNGFLGSHLLTKFCTVIDSDRDKFANASITTIDNGITSCSSGVSRPYIQNYDENLIGFDFNRLKPVTTIIHMAGLASPAQYRKYPIETIDVAVTVTKKLLLKAQEWNAKLVFFSSSEIYGNPDPASIPTSEDYNGNVSCQGPRACYDESKRMGETLCYVYNTVFNVNTNVIRPFNIYGPGMSPNDYRMIPNLMRSAKEGTPVTVFGSGTQTRTFCYVSDAIDAISRITESGLSGETYNIGNPHPELSMLDLVKTFIKATGVQQQLVLSDYPNSYPGDEPLRRCPDIKKVQNHVGYIPQVGIEEGLRKTWEWTIEQ